MFCYELCKIWRALFKFVSSVFSLSILKVVQQGPHMCNNSIPMFRILFPNLAWFVSIPTAKRLQEASIWKPPIANPLFLWLCDSVNFNFVYVYIYGQSLEIFYADVGRKTTKDGLSTEIKMHD